MQSRLVTWPLFERNKPLSARWSESSPPRLRLVPERGRSAQFSICLISSASVTPRRAENHAVRNDRARDQNPLISAPGLDKGSYVPIAYSVKGKTRLAEIPGILHMSVDPLPTAHPSGEMWANVGHPVSPEKLAFAMGAPGNTFSDHGMRWDNSGKNGHYAPIRWSSTS